MIEKIYQIRNVGRFQNYNAQGEVEFRPITLVYAENGSGKTTLSSILKSLKDQDNNAIIERKTLGVEDSDSQKIKMRAFNKEFLFTNELWNNKCGELEIFDSSFVNRNVFSGQFVDHSQKRNLYQFVIGDEQVKLAESINELDVSNRKLGQEVSELKAKLKLIHKEVLLEDFLHYKQDEFLDTKISETEAKIKECESADKILSFPLLKRVSIPEIQLDVIITNLADDLESASKDVAQQVRNHIATNLGVGDSEAWLRKGLEASKKSITETCPFCAQSIESLEIIDLFKVYFSEAYANLFKTIESNLNFINQELSDRKLSDIETLILANERDIQVWSSILPYESFSEDRTGFSSKWRELHQLLLQGLEKKKVRPLEVITDISENAKELLDSIYGFINQYNQYVDGFNEKATRKKNQEGLDIFELKSERATFLVYKDRFKKEFNGLCEEYLITARKKEEGEELKSKLGEELTESEGDLLKQYQNKINEYLIMFGAAFRIADNHKVMTGGKPSASYCILLKKEKIQLGGPNTEGKPSFKNLLSEGDKSTLAFALFLAKLESEKDLSNKIVVIDDPISSLDVHRQTSTRNRIVELAGKIQQLILLSHNQIFLNDFYNHGSIKSNKVRLLYIRKIGEESSIDKWNLEETFTNSYFHQHRIVKEYIDSDTGDTLEIARCLRPMLEENLRTRFPETFKRDIWLGDMVKLIRESESSAELSLMKPVLLKIADVNDYTSSFHHGGSKSVNKTELKAYAELTFKILKGLPIIA